MGWGKLAILSVCLLAGCVGKNSPSQACDPQTEDCSVGPGGTGRCVRDSDCGDGICQPDGTCRAVQPVTQPTACANVSCPAGNFCSNGQCIPATAQCKQADPACIFIPHGAFEPPEHAWWWPWPTPQGPDAASPLDVPLRTIEYPDYVQVMSTPVVMRLNAKDVEPAVGFNTFPDHPAGLQGSEMLEVQGVMRAVRGSDGAPLWTAPKDMWNHMQWSIDGNSGIAAGDCMGTGEVCFITGGWDPDDQPPRVPNSNLAHRHGGLIAFGSDGRFRWVTREAQIYWGAPVIARLLGPDGRAQVVVGNGVFDAATGKTLCPQTNELGAVGGNGDGTLSAVADLDLDGIPEVVTGNQAYKLVKNDASPTGYSCTAMFSAGVRMPGNLACAGGAPTIADFDGDGMPEVGVASQSAYSVWKPGRGW